MRGEYIGNNPPAEEIDVVRAEQRAVMLRRKLVQRAS
jgi:hypothetical protein